MSGHTPGPWAVVDGYYPGFLKIVGPSFDISIVTTAVDIDFKGFCSRTSDARLIAAAPELLEALSGMLEIYGVREQHMDREPFASSTEVDCCNKARAAIAKAKGEA